jgi:hypothetical protein
MRNALLLPLAVLALAGLSACGKAKNEAVEANETLTGDSNTMGEAVSDVNAAEAAAFGAAENAYAGNVADLPAEEGSETAGNEIIE